MVIDFNAIKTLYLANNEVEELYINGSKVWEKPASIFTVQARTSNVTIGSSAQGSPSQRSLEYSVDNGETWNTFTLGSTTVTLANAGDKMMLRGTNSTIANTWQNYWKLTFSDDVDVLGNLNSLLGGSEDTLTGSFYGLFDGQTHLIDASGLVMPWTTIASIAASDCAALEAMFRNCSGLVSAPDLPATTAESYCYKSMFQNCTSLATAPSLPATTMGVECYNGMFNGCTALTTPPPSLPATTLPIACYQGMFNGCTSLTATPATLGATTMSGRDAMREMFMNCTSLTSAFDINVSAPSVNAFYDTFYGCSSLTGVNMSQVTDAPQNAFREMFYGCTSLTTAPDVFDSISSVGQRAFSKTFYGCTSLTQIPTLPTALGNMCFEHMFEGCTGLTGTIDLTQFTDIQGTGSGYGAFDYAFVGCTGITKVDLSSLTTAQGIYHEFDGCTSLAELDLSNLETIRSDSQSAFENMCNGCTSLTTVRLNKLASMGSYTTQWRNTFKGCSSLQNIYMNETQTIPYFYNNDTFTGTNADFRIVVPDALYDQWIVANGWSAQGVVEHIIGAIEAETLTFTAAQAGSTIAMNAVGTAPSVSLEYSTDGGDTWNDFTVGSTTITLSNVGDKANIRAKSPNPQFATLDTDYNVFSITGQAAVSGNLAAILNKDVEQGAVLDSALRYHLTRLFVDCTGLAGSMRKLKIPFKTIGYATFSNTFKGTSITEAPELEFTALGNYSCFSMFNGCTALTTPPSILPATSIPTYGYYRMFSGCTSLTSAPDIKAQDVSTGHCLEAMFSGCTSLTSISLKGISAIWTGGQNALTIMCAGCTSLVSMDMSNCTDMNGQNACRQMFDGCTSLTTINLDKLKSVWGSYAVAQMFQNCSSLVEVELPVLVQFGNNYVAQKMFLGCSSLTNVSLPVLANTYGTQGVYGMFDSCTSLKTLDVRKLSGIHDTRNCDYWFAGCAALESIDFTEATSVPTLTNTNAFVNTNSTFEVVVPDGLYEHWIVAGNWGSYARHIVKEGSSQKTLHMDFTAEEANSTVSLAKTGTPPDVSLEYSTDNGTTWSDLIVGTTTVTLSNEGDKVMMRAKEANAAFGSGSSAYHYFTGTGKLSVSGNLMGIISSEANTGAVGYSVNHGLRNLFYGMTALVDASGLEIPFVSIAGTASFARMFENCTNLTKGPVIQWASITNTYTMDYYFSGCSSLQEITFANYEGDCSWTSWVNGVPSGGTIYKNGSSTGIPSGWTMLPC